MPNAGTGPILLSSAASFLCSIAGAWYVALRLIVIVEIVANKPQVNTYGTYSSYYRQHLLPDRDIELLNLVGSTQSFVVLTLSAVVGRFLDAGHVRDLLIAGTILVSLGSFLLSIVNGQGRYDEGSYSLIWLTQGLVSGLGMACFFVSSSQGQCLRRHSTDYRGLTRPYSCRYVVQGEERACDWPSCSRFASLHSMEASDA